MLPPGAPQASVSGSSPELNSVGATVPLQATPGIPIFQVHPGDVTVATEPAGDGVSSSRQSSGSKRADGLGLISHEHSAVTSVEPLANLGETHSQAESSEAREETRIAAESLANLGEPCCRVESSEEREEANEAINNVEPLDDVIGKIAGLPARDGDGQQFTDRAQVGASPTIEPRASSLIEPTERASPVVVLQASIVTDRARMMA